MKRAELLDKSARKIATVARYRITDSFHCILYVWRRLNNVRDLCESNSVLV